MSVCTDKPMLVTHTLSGRDQHF